MIRHNYSPVRCETSTAKRCNPVLTSSCIGNERVEAADIAKTRVAGLNFTQPGSGAPFGMVTTIMAAAVTLEATFSGSAKLNPAEAVAISAGTTTDI